MKKFKLGRVPDGDEDEEESPAQPEVPTKPPTEP